jgi:PhnB protein
MKVEIPPITPYLVVSNAAEAIEFYKTAFGATQDGESHLMPGTDKIMHARLVINGGLIMICDDLATMMGRPPSTPDALGGSPITLALQLEDVQTFWDKAVAGGAIVTMPLADMFWGDRYGQVTDPYGHKWSMSQTIKVMSDEEMQQAAEKQMSETGSLGGPVREDMVEDDSSGDGSGDGSGGTTPPPPPAGGLQPTDDWGN